MRLNVAQAMVEVYEDLMSCKRTKEALAIYGLQGADISLLNEVIEERKRYTRDIDEVEELPSDADAWCEIVPSEPQRYPDPNEGRIQWAPNLPVRSCFSNW